MTQDTDLLTPSHPSLYDDACYDKACYEECLNDLYSSYMQVKSMVQSLPDSLTRQPERILSIARQLDLLPSAKNVIKITGSKGKGTTARMIDAGFRRCFFDSLRHPQHKDNDIVVGLFVSPEEQEHNDRIRINGSFMPKKDFVQVYRELKPVLDEARSQLTGMEYLSPNGIYLLMALYYFKAQGVSHYVLECGRGALYDEVGNIESQYAVVTSLAEEHQQYLGKTLQDIALHKLAVLDNSEMTFVPASLKTFLSTLGLKAIEGDQAKIQWIPDVPSDIEKNMPHWVQQNQWCSAHVLKQALSLTGSLDVICPVIPLESTSFGDVRGVLTDDDGVAQNSVLIWEAIIHRKSIDKNFIRHWVKAHPHSQALLCLTDDKDLEGVVAELLSLGLRQQYHVLLTGKSGVFEFENTRRLFSHNILGTVDWQDEQTLLALLKTMIQRQPYLYCIGRQDFIRLVKRASLSLFE